MAVISGLFMGLMTLEPLTLMIKIRTTDNDEERKNCQALMPIVEQNHRVLVTLLLLDGIAYEALPLFLDDLVPTSVAIILSVTFVLLFGEIIPCAIFAGPNQLPLAVKLTPLMRVLLVLLAPIAVPLAKLLDYIVGVSAGGEDHDTKEAYNRKELTALIRIQNEHAYLNQPNNQKQRRSRHATRHIHNNNNNGSDVPVDHKDRRTWNAFKREIMEAVEAKMTTPAGRHQRKYSDDNMAPDYDNQISPPLHQAKVNMVEGALQMKTKCAMDVYTPLRMMFAVPSDMVLTKNSIMEIYSQGYSRVPVYQPTTETITTVGVGDNHPSNGDDHDDVVLRTASSTSSSNYDRTTAMCGILLTRQLMVIDWDDEREVSTLPLIRPPYP